jgi:hypothetical protein
LRFLQETKVKSVRYCVVNTPTKALAGVTGIDKITGGCLPCMAHTRAAFPGAWRAHHGGRGRGCSNVLASAGPARSGSEKALAGIERGHATACDADAPGACSETHATDFQPLDKASK